MSLDLPKITNFSIYPKTNTGTKKYLDSITRKLPENWKYLRNEPYEDKESFFILEQVYCIEAVYSFDNGKPNFAKLFIGRTNTKAFLLKIHNSDLQKKKITLDDVNFLLYWFHYFILRKSKYYEKFDHKFEYGGHLDNNNYETDIRNSRKVNYYSKTENKPLIMDKGLQGKLDDRNVINYFLPNNVGISLSISKKNYKKAKSIHDGFLSKAKRNKVLLEHEDKESLFDYFEYLITSITFAYNAIETMANTSIPNDHTIEVKNERGITEIWNKENLLRWKSTSDKVKDILPKIFQTTDITKEKFWSSFIDLERLRNDIIHQKINLDYQKGDIKLYNQLLSKNVFKWVSSSIDLVSFFYNLDRGNSLFPLGLGIAEMKFKEIESINEVLNERNFDGN